MAEMISIFIATMFVMTVLVGIVNSINKRKKLEEERELKRLGQAAVLAELTEMSIQLKTCPIVRKASARTPRENRKYVDNTPDSLILLGAMVAMNSPEELGSTGTNDWAGSGGETSGAGASESWDSGSSYDSGSSDSGGFND